MRKRRSVLALLLAGCLALGTLAPAEALAQEDEMAAKVQQADVQETEETGAEEREAQTPSEGQEQKEPELQESDGLPEMPEMTEEVSGEEMKVDPQDPGKFRLSGQGEGDTEASKVSVKAASSAKKYSDCILQKGIDVSYHNGTINWNKVKKDGVNFAIIRVAYRGYENGKLTVDTKALENMKKANAAGVPIGVYIFSQAVSAKEAVQEADYIVNKIKGYKIELPVVLDFEYVAVGVGRLYKAKLSKSEATGVCTSFCKRVEQLGYTPMVYASKSMYEDEIYAAEISQKYPVWMAHYTSKTTDYSGEYEYWQYSSTGKVAGINDHYVDFNYRYLNSLRITGNKAKSISMKWEAYQGASEYDVYRKTGNGNYKLFKADVAGTSFTDTSVSPGASYSYKIYAGGKCIGFNTGITALDTAKLKAKAKAFDKVGVSWSKVPGASYKVQRYSGSKKTYATIKTVKGSSGASYTDGSRNASTTYKYRVRPYKIVFNGRTYGSYSEAAAKTKKAVKGKTKSRGIYLRKSSSKSSKKLGTLKKKGTKVTVSGSSGSWYRISVKINGKKRTGYIKKSNIKLY